MSANRPTGGAALVRQRLSGVVFLAVLAGLIGLSIAFYNKVFTPVVMVSLETDRIGNQLTPPADVKVNGVIIGEARSVEATEDGALVELALEPDAAERLPANVSARLVPKTLFGEKFVDIVLPEQPVEQSLAAAGNIPQDRSSSARETETALNNFLPLLQTLQPDAVSTTLNAVSTALRGRGERIGSNLVLARDYFVEINPELPRLERNLAGTADFADTLDAAAPDYLALFDDLSAINRNLVRDEEAIEQVLLDTAAFAGTAESFTRENEERFITLARESVPNLQLYAEYSPQFPCLSEGLRESKLFIADTFGTLQPGLHITLEFTEAQEAYRPTEDEPAYLSTRGPDCFGLPRPVVPDPGFAFVDGVRTADEEPEGPQRTYPQQQTGNPPPTDDSGFARASATDAAAERTVVNAVVAPFLGVQADEVPDVAHLLFAPVARGTTVGLSAGSPGSAS